MLEELLELVCLLELVEEDDLLLDVLDMLEVDEGGLSLPASVGADETEVGFSVAKLDPLPPPAPPHALNNIKHKRLLRVSLYLLWKLKQCRLKNIKFCIS